MVFRSPQSRPIDLGEKRTDTELFGIQLSRVLFNKCGRSKGVQMVDDYSHPSAKIRSRQQFCRKVDQQFSDEIKKYGDQYGASLVLFRSERSLSAFRDVRSTLDWIPFREACLGVSS